MQAVLICSICLKCLQPSRALLFCVCVREREPVYVREALVLISEMLALVLSETTDGQSLRYGLIEGFASSPGCTSGRATRTQVVHSNSKKGFFSMNSLVVRQPV